MKATTVNQEEVNKFSKLSDKWWDQDGEFSILHRINPIRLTYIKEKIIEHFGSFYENIDILDIGCGGGITTIPLARMGAKIVGIDASLSNIQAADAYAKQQNIDVGYIYSAVEDYYGAHDVVLCLELLEHVENPEFFIASAANLIKPGGILILSTINKNIKSYIETIIFGEYITKWIPIGTHAFSKFLKPSELAKYINHSGLEIKELNGLRYDIFSNSFSITNDISVNYFITATKHK